jgi:hypothetical protein
MVKHLRAVPLVVLLLSGGSFSCESTEVPPSAAELTREPNYMRGFHAEERGANGGTWRWMGPEGVIRFRNTHYDMTLTITIWVPAELPGGTTATYDFNGERLDMIPGLRGERAKEYAISASRQGRGNWSELRIRTSRPFVPAQVIPGSVDHRELGLSVSHVSWNAR